MKLTKTSMIDETTKEEEEEEEVRALLKQTLTLKTTSKKVLKTKISLPLEALTMSTTTALKTWTSLPEVWKDGMRLSRQQQQRQQHHI